MFRKYGLTIIPARMYPIIRGCFRRRMIPAVRTVTAMIRLSSMNISIALLLVLGKMV